MNRLVPLFLSLVLIFSACKSNKPTVSGSKHPVAALWPIVDSTEGKWGYIDPQGQVVISPRFDYAGRFSEGMARISMDGLFGYIDTTGRLIVRPNFLRAGDYSDGRARVRADANQSRYYLDRDGIPVIPPDSLRADAKDFSEGMAAVLSEGKWGFIDTTGAVKVPFTYAAAGKFEGGSAPVKLVEAWGLIDKQGNWLIPAKYAWLDNYSDGLLRARVREYGAPFWCFLDRKYEVVLKLQGYEEVWPYSEGLAHAKQKGKWGYLDKKGRWAIEPTFSSATSFSEGFAAVKTDSLWGYIDKQGTLTIPARYTLADPFEGGLAYVNLPKRWGYIDKNGKLIWKSAETSALPDQDHN